MLISNPAFQLSRSALNFGKKGSKYSTSLDSAATSLKIRNCVNFFA